MADDIDIGISVHADPRAIAAIEAIKASFASLRSDLSKTIDPGATLEKVARGFVTQTQSLGAELQKLGATEQQITQIGAAVGDSLLREMRAIGLTEAQVSQFGKTIQRVEQETQAAKLRTGAATQQTTAATTAQAVAQTQAARATTQAGAAVAGAAQKAAAFVPAANNVTIAIQKIPSGARTAANALSMISNSALTGTGSLGGMANAAGGLAFGLSQLSSNASVVAGAAGLGAVISVAALLIGVFATLRKRQEEVNKGLGDLSKTLSSAGLDAIRGSLESVSQGIEQLSKKRDELAKKEIQQNLGLARGGLIGAAITGAEVSKLDTRLNELFETRTKLQTAFAEHSAATEREITDLTIKNNQDALESYVRRTQGEAAAERIRIQTSFALEEGEIRRSGVLQQFKDKALDAARKKAASERATVDQRESEALAQRRAESETRLAKLTGDAQVAASKEAFDKDEAANAESRARRFISERTFINDRLTLELKAIGRELQARLESIDTQIAAERTLLDAETEPAKRQKVVDDIKALGEERTKATNDANVKIAAANAQAGKDAADLARRVIEATQEAARGALEVQGKFVEAARIELHKQFDDLIREAEQAGDTIGAAALRHEVQIRLQQAAVREIDTGLSRAAAEAENRIARANILLGAHAIAASTARKEIVAALEGERDAVARSIPALQKQADLLGGDDETLKRIDALTTKLLELNVSIAQTGDQFFELKRVGRDAAESAIAGFLEGAAKLGSQSHAEVNALTADLKSAQAEMQELLAIPAAQRTGEANKRISELRAEIESTSVSLENAKSSITSWRDLFVSALQSIADALIRVSSQMLATALIEKLLFAIAGGGGSLAPSGAPLSGGLLGGGALNAASGGRVRGPGTSTSDSIPAWLSNEEYVIRASRVRQFGQAFFDAINFAGEIPPIVLPSRVRRYAAGGFVESQSPGPFGSGGGGGGGSLSHRFHFTLADGIIEDRARRFIESPDGHAVVVTVAQKNARKLGLPR